MKRIDGVFLASANIGLGLFIGVIISCLAKLEFNLFVWHPICALIFIVLVTEGVLQLQPTCTPEEKKRGLRWHAAIISLAYTFAIACFGIIAANKVIHRAEHYKSMHGRFGLAVFVYLFLQALFGLTMAFTPGLYGGVKKAKNLWKFHRMTGYILLGLVWITALLGAHRDTIYKHLATPELMWVNWAALTLVVVGVAGRARVAKMLGTQHAVSQNNV